jgi:hypothetical protein
MALLEGTTRRIRGVPAVIEVCSAGSCKGSLQLGRPLLVGLSESSHLVGGQVQITRHPPERFAGIDRIEKLLP